LAYAIYRLFILDYSLVSIGLVAFVVIAQLAPPFCYLFWRRGSKMALSPESFSDLLFVLYLTNSVCNRHDKFSQSFFTEGPWGISLLKPFQLLGWII
jgi:Na+/proline symporter